MTRWLSMFLLMVGVSIAVQAATAFPAFPTIPSQAQKNTGAYPQQKNFRKYPRNPPQSRGIVSNKPHRSLITHRESPYSIHSR